MFYFFPGPPSSSYIESSCVVTTVASRLNGRKLANDEAVANLQRNCPRCHSDLQLTIVLLRYQQSYAKDSVNLNL